MRRQSHIHVSLPQAARAASFPSSLDRHCGRDLDLKKWF